ncbi:pyridoxal 5'-phosphate synthase glutaminase subunit PdxT [Paramaledivibacter caminithermalis]|uniref:Pyridoxal 5'-phosphate synthase subunit PdxT n=1 Tax=Paramaledivibacter caminithermalis (strain DSM 15212 / CIP 107654 / DViRD3) TaxID=1121301 RepID=A0A1M6MXZ3_PARC5|nr:pyridoxal 5'-phosphate synthase glutaminase subunit PdxT [Paramaledivibacter caminithermalis]SHJ88213.1 pyridoxal phosphate synthase yaaE subunit [Paramaledivibacter caminithermalis DSM 15212]
MIIGVLALQGAFREHMKCLKKIGIHGKLVKSNKDLEGIDGIILPGGESTAMGKLLVDFNMKENLSNKIKNGLPAWGTCAGMILLAKKIDGENKAHLGVMDIDVKRNAYGRQLGSFSTEKIIPEISDEPIELVFIRAPYINSVNNGVDILCEVDGNIVAAKQRNILVTSFHPELTENRAFHRYFVKMIKNNKSV